MIEDNNLEPITASDTDDNNKTTTEKNILPNKNLVFVSVLPVLAVIAIVAIIWFLSRGSTDNMNSEVTPKSGNATPTTTTSGISSTTKITTTDAVTPNSPSPTISPVQKEYILNRISILGEVNPYIKLEFTADPNYKITLGGQNNNELVIESNLFTIRILTITEQAYWGQYENMPEFKQVETTLNADTVFRVKSNIPQYPSYHYSTSFERRDQGGCTAYSGPDIVACDGGSIIVSDVSKRGSIAVGCNVENEENVRLCDQLISSMKATVL